MTKCEICVVRDMFKSDIEKMTPGIGGRRPRLVAIEEYLINNQRPELVTTFPKRKVRPSRLNRYTGGLAGRVGKIFGALIGRQSAPKISADDEQLIRSFDAAQIAQTVDKEKEGGVEAAGAGEKTREEIRRERKKRRRTAKGMPMSSAEFLENSNKGSDTEKLKIQGRDPFPKTLRHSMMVSAEHREKLNIVDADEDDR